MRNKSVFDWETHTDHVQTVLGKHNINVDEYEAQRLMDEVLDEKAVIAHVREKEQTEMIWDCEVEIIHAFVKIELQLIANNYIKDTL